MLKLLSRIAIAIFFSLTCLFVSPSSASATEYVFDVINGVAQQTFIVKADEHIDIIAVSTEESGFFKYRTYIDTIYEGDFQRGISLNVMGASTTSSSLLGMPCSIGETPTHACFMEGSILSVEVGGQSQNESPRIPASLTITVRTE